MEQKAKIKDEMKVWIYYIAHQIAAENNTELTFDDVNSVVIDILHENNKHDPKELFKTT
jgi:hypothetical protein